MPSGSCFCGTTKYEYSGEPAMKVICHCLSCRKISGSPFGTALLIPVDSFKFTSAKAPKTTTIHHETGLPMHIQSCPDCGNTLGKTAPDGFPGLFILYAGTIDGEAKEWTKIVEPQAELWVQYRVPWLGEVKGAKQCQTFE